MLEVAGLTPAERGVPHLAEVAGQIARGQLTTLLGRTGAGKTSLMRVIAGLLAPAAGVVTLDGEDWRRLPPWKRPVVLPDRRRRGRSGAGGGDVARHRIAAGH